MKYLSVLLLAIILSNTVFSQVQIIGRSKGWAVDSYGIFGLGKNNAQEIAQTSCTISKKSEVGCSSIEVRVQPEISDKLNQIHNIVTNAFVETQKLVGTDVTLDDVRIYVLKGRMPSDGYHYQLESTYPLFQMIVYLNDEDSNLFCKKEENKFCNTIYKTLAHELTHPHISSDVRWLEEAVCTLVGETVAKNLTGKDAPNFTYLPLLQVLAQNSKQLASWKKNDESEATGKFTVPFKSTLEAIKYETSYYLLINSFDKATLNKDKSQIVSGFLKTLIKKKISLPWDLQLTDFEDVFGKFNINPQNPVSLTDKEKLSIVAIADRDLSSRNNSLLAALTLYALDARLSQSALMVLIEDLTKDKSNFLAAKILNRNESNFEFESAFRKVKTRMLRKKLDKKEFVKHLRQFKFQIKTLSNSSLNSEFFQSLEKSK